MLSPLAPRMMTVSDSRPSYMLVWYIATPLLQVHSDRCGHRYLCDQAEETAWRVYCHKLAQESKPDYIHTTGADVFPACQGSCRVSRPLQKRRRGPHLLTQGEVFRRPASLPVADDQRWRIRTCAFPGTGEERHAWRQAGPEVHLLPAHERQTSTGNSGLRSGVIGGMAEAEDTLGSERPRRRLTVVVDIAVEFEPRRRLLRVLRTHALRHREIR